MAKTERTSPSLLDLAAKFASAAGLIAVVATAVGAAYLAGYLAGYHIPPYLTTIDPSAVAAAAEFGIGPILVFLMAWAAAAWLLDRVELWPRRLKTVPARISLLIGLFFLTAGVEIVTRADAGGVLIPAVFGLGTTTLLMPREIGLPDPGRLIILGGLALITTAAFGGLQAAGARDRTSRSARPLVEVVLKVPLDGREGTMSGDTWCYRDLDLFYEDAERLFVNFPLSADTRTWIIRRDDVQEIVLGTREIVPLGEGPSFRLAEAPSCVLTSSPSPASAPPAAPSG